MKPHHGDPDQALDCFAQCARPQTSTRLAPRSVRRASGTPAKYAGYQADFPGLGRGLRGASGTPAKYAEYQADFLGLGRGLRSLKQVLDWPSFTEIEFITT